MGEPRDIEADDTWWQKSETNNEVGCLLVWNGHLPGVHDFCCLVAASGLRHEQVICGHRPFLDLPRWSVAGAIIEGKRPTRPAVGFTDFLWRVAESCWQHEPEDRPSAGTVVGWLDGA